MRYGTGLWGNAKISRPSSSDSNSGNAIIFERELIADEENDWNIGAILQATFLVFHNRKPLFSAEWSGATTEVLHVEIPTVQFDTIQVVSVYNGYFEKELADAEDEINVGMVIRSNSMVFFNGNILMTSEWSGVGLESLTILFPVSEFDKLIFVNR